MRRRLRKKLRLGEFQELGFEVSFRCRPGLSDGERDQLLWDFVEQAVEANGLVAGGGGGPEELSFFVCLDGRGSATDGHRSAVGAWLGSEGRVSEWRVGPLVDAWNGEVGEPSSVGLRGQPLPEHRYGVRR